MSDNAAGIIKALVRMLRESDQEVLKEVRAMGDPDNPMSKSKLEMVERHRKQLKEMGLI